MGLFSNRRVSRRDSVWTTESFHANTSDEKKSFNESFMSHQETATVTSFDRTVSTGCDTSSDGKGDNGAPTSKDILTMKIKLLERQLKQRDETISQLRTAMESEDERVALLELQLGRLVELSSKQLVARQQRHESQIIDAEPPVRRCVSAGATTGSGGRRASRRPSLSLLPEQHETEMEISALQQLLARVIAEKDRLGYENGNLKNFIKDQQDNAVVCPKCAGGSSSPSKKKNMPSTIEDLDNHLEEKEKAISFHHQDDSLEGSFDQPPPKKSISFHHGNDEEYSVPKKSISFHEDFSKPKPKRHSAEDKEVVVSKSKSFHHGDSRAHKSSSVSPNKKQVSLPDDYSKKPEEEVEPQGEQASIMYQMSCRSCSDTHPDLKYMSSWITTGSASETKKELIRVLKTHYRQVWYLVQEHNIDGSCHSDISSIQDEEFNNHFEHSSLAKHLAKHCELCETEAMVMKWCMKNIRVEIQKNTISGEENVEADVDVSHGKRSRSKSVSGRSRSKSIGRRSKSKSVGRRSKEHFGNKSFHL